MISVKHKILCVGAEIDQTDHIVSDMAVRNNSKNHGLINDTIFQSTKAGYYHTTVADIPAGAIVTNLAQHFDLIVMLDQSIDSYPHWKSFVHTFRLMLQLEEKGLQTDFRNNINNKDILYWYNLLHRNPSLCVYPFINLINDYGSAAQCQKQSTPVTKIESIKDWSTDPNFLSIRSSMLAGIKMPDRCNVCYEREETGKESLK